MLEQDFRDGLNGRLSVFHNELKDPIGTTLFTSSTIQIMNLSDANTTGVEAELEKRFKSGLRGFINGTWQSSRTDIGDFSQSVLINSPARIANLGVVVPVFGDKLAVSLRQNYISERATTQPGQNTPDWFLTHLTLSSQNALPNWSFFFSVFNLFNNRNEVAVGHDSSVVVVPQQGCMFVLRASYKF